MTTFVLVHGGFHGGWCWKKVTSLLQASKKVVYAPTLTGLGERAHLLHPSVNLSTHIQDIVNLLFYEDLRDVVLVGHSYGGMVITGVAEAVPERLSRLIYLDAVVPQDGESFFSATRPELRERWSGNATTLQGARVYPTPPYPWVSFLDLWQVTDPEDVAWMEPRLTPHPLAVMEEPVTLSPQRAGQVPASFILCSGTKRSTMSSAQRVQLDAQRAQSDPNWRYGELDSGHEAQITVPAALTDLLLRLA